MAGRFFSTLLALPVMLCIPLAAGESEPGRTPSVLIENYLKAYNAHDIEAMLQMVTDDVEWLSIAKDSIQVETKGKEALRKAMAAYFEQLPSAHSEIEAVMVSGSLVSVRERAHWESKDGPKSQMALSVYQIHRKKIQRIWYFPAER